MSAKKKKKKKKKKNYDQNIYISGKGLIFSTRFRRQIFGMSSISRFRAVQY